MIATKSTSSEPSVKKRRRITRNRVIKSCKCCYKYKLKCDKATPCSACVSRGTVNQCEYGFNKTLENPAYDLATSTALINSGTAHLGKIDSNIINNESYHLGNDVSKATSSFSKRIHLDDSKIWKVSEESTVYKSKYFYPFFTNSINDKFLSSETYGKVILSGENFIRNEITKFNRFHFNSLANTSEVLDLFPTTPMMARSQIEVFFEWVYPIIPVINKEKVLDKLDKIYDFLLSSTIQGLKSNPNKEENINVHSRVKTTSINKNSHSNDINILDLLLIVSIFFCSAYCNVASGIIPDLLLCNKYYAAYQHLLKLSEFPIKPVLESLQSFLLVNFVTDPNMVDATGYSPMLVRMGQQLGLHKLESHPRNKDLIFLWHYILYVEGSASVVSGFPFSSSKVLLNCVPVPKMNSKLFITNTNVLSLHENSSNSTARIPMEYSIGRFKINLVFKEIMDSTITRGPLANVLKQNLIEQVTKLYTDISELISSMRVQKYTHTEYYTSTLLVFLYRLHLRYYALEKIHGQNSILNNNKNDRHTKLLENRKHMIKMVNSGKEEVELVKPRDLTWILETTQDVKEDVIPLCLLLLLATLKRLVQKNINNFAWYTRGSTVMQYLFVVLRDLYQNPKKEYALEHFNPLFRDTISDDIKEIINTSPLYFKLVLIEELLPLIELKLTPLWKKNDLYKFILVKTVKNKVWQTHGPIWDNDEEIKTAKRQLQECGLFASGNLNLENTKSITLENCLAQWSSDIEMFDPEQIVVDWLDDFN